MPVLQVPAVSIQTILFATDFTRSSERAEAYAKALALRFGSKLELAHVFDPTVVTSWEAAELEVLPEERLLRSQEWLSSVEKRMTAAGIENSAICRGAHRPAATLIELAAEQDADLIVAGTQSKTGIERLVLGSTAEQLIRGAQCPVLTVGPKTREPKPGPLTFHTVVYANDFSPEATKAAVYALLFAEDSAAHLYCCYVVPKEGGKSENREELDRKFQEALKARIPESTYDWCSPECVVEHGEPASAILSLAGRVSADLIVLGARKSSFWLTRIERGLAPALLAEAPCPVLTVC